MAGRANAPKGSAWTGHSDEYNRNLNGFEAVITKEDSGRRVQIWSKYEPTKTLRDEAFPTLKAAKAYADDALTNEPAANLQTDRNDLSVLKIPPASITVTSGELPSEEYHHNIKDSELVDWHPPAWAHDAYWRLVDDDGQLIQEYRGAELLKIAISRRSGAADPGVSVSDKSSVNIKDSELAEWHPTSEEIERYWRLVNDDGTIIRAYSGEELNHMAMARREALMSQSTRTAAPKPLEPVTTNAKTRTITPKQPKAQDMPNPRRGRTKQSAKIAETGGAENVTVRMGKSK